MAPRRLVYGGKEKSKLQKPAAIAGGETRASSTQSGSLASMSVRPAESSGPRSLPVNDSQQAPSPTTKTRPRVYGHKPDANTN
eukprot:CAMPEP_0206492328 /NCGR_PEP_ID=MMETSP0324_2-20121206/45972_1 /ASSEMBLY_ACC=CAM_ASM_000836 /TAXON_ID=2866 /ORGANISM="Crypthecodinium cohnii, Strain Seligo" /LENGTH=82 /DNA_ID=CAMNT_0053974581 /DNA_START=316 /DNA_END=561 /DNA_ORIENTATION=-